ncbi:hypothetical protein CC80DRAFT_431768 [Byssothecium circinans]|uniref:Uncharacterized protein n=1 Tax=Byssothecium circinans TaxID=147558 RepID=A0A6A5T6S1_9PLEO|nr:hypothetical protein CC80DRAFT_431768 [Byssothecium circinans]
MPGQSFRDAGKTELEAIVLTTPKPDEKQKREKSFRRKGTSRVACVSRWLAWLKKNRRPKVKPGYRRLEWQCDCGVDLYADFPGSDRAHLDNLAFSLQSPGQPSVTQAPDIPLGHSDTPAAGSSDASTQGAANKMGTSPRDSTKQSIGTVRSANTLSQVGDSRPRFLALCVNIGGIYKTLAEIDMTRITSDAALFLEMKKEYLKKRGRRSRFEFLIKPKTVEFVQFTLWNLRHGYVSVCKRPNCIPPNDSHDYEYLPKPLIPPPMPPEVFVHYLEHGEGDLNPNRNDWLSRLPKRLDKRIIDCEQACVGWGMHVIEGPNREGIFWIIMITMLAVVLTSVLWSTLRSDVQGGVGLGALIVALQMAILAAFLFRLGEV